MMMTQAAVYIVIILLLQQFLFQIWLKKIPMYKYI